MDVLAKYAMVYVVFIMGLVWIIGLPGWFVFVWFEHPEDTVVKTYSISMGLLWLAVNVIMINECIGG